MVYLLTHKCRVILSRAAAPRAHYQLHLSQLQALVSRQTNVVSQRMERWWWLIICLYLFCRASLQSSHCEFSHWWTPDFINAQPERGVVLFFLPATLHLWPQWLFKFRRRMLQVQLGKESTEIKKGKRSSVSHLYTVLALANSMVQTF